MKEPLISIALCTYNGEKYLEQQLDSIIDQTHHNIEIIIVDDCSSDNTFNIIQQYAKKDNRIKAYRNDINLGYNKNFEKAISLTTGEYISISDQDDIWKADKLEILLKGLDGHWLVFSNSEWMEEDGSYTDKTLLNNFSLQNKGYKIILFTNYMPGHASLFKREFLNYLLPFPETGFYDWWMLFIALYHNKVVYIDKALTKYRIHSGSVIQSILVKDKNKLQYNLFKVNIDQYAVFESYPDLKSEDREFISKFRKAYALKEKFPYSIPLVKIIYNNYELLFSQLKVRKGLSKLNFAFKNAKKVKNW